MKGIRRSPVKETGREIVIVAVSSPMTGLVTRKIDITGMTVNGSVIGHAIRTVKEIEIVRGTVKEETGTAVTVDVIGIGTVREIVIGAVTRIGNVTESGAVNHVIEKGKDSFWVEYMLHITCS